LTLDPLFLERFSVTASYDYLYGLDGFLDESKNFPIEANWKIDKDGHYILKASYENGETPILSQDKDLFSIGLGIKF